MDVVHTFEYEKMKQKFLPDVQQLLNAMSYESAT